MKRAFTFFFGILSLIYANAQQSPAVSSAGILQKLNKLKILGSVLYIAAHPDDENTRLLAYLANGRLYRSGYLSLTRGDGGQNLIGDEQGIELGLIRTQELLAARRIDGAEQFFSRAYDFGFCKRTEEALEKWNKDIILSDVVWVIRKFRPDVIITRFPEDSRAGHGHHSASAVLAHLAFEAAADPTKFPEQLKDGVTVWQAKRIMWNTYNFGNLNTQDEKQLKIDVGGYNALLGKSYGEIAAESRSQHKSQGFGVPAQRGAALEYFSPVAGETATRDIMDGVNTTWQRLKNTGGIEAMTDSLIANFSYEHPERSVPGLVKLYRTLTHASLDEYWKTQKLGEVHDLIQLCSGLYFEATTDVPYIAAGDSLKININLVNRAGLNFTSASLNLLNKNLPSPLPADQSIGVSGKIFVPVNMAYSEPYWLQKGLNDAHFIVDDQALIGLPQNRPAFNVALSFEIDNLPLTYSVPLQYKHTDPVQGEQYQPFYVVPALSLYESPRFVFTHLNNRPPTPIQLQVTAFTDLKKAKAGYFQYEYKGKDMVKNSVMKDTALSLSLHGVDSYELPSAVILKNTGEKELRFFSGLHAPYKEYYQPYTIRTISYSHIPTIMYLYQNKVKVIDEKILTSGKKIGYITGAGDKVPEALKDMGYDVTFLDDKNIRTLDLSSFDAIVGGVRAYNVHDWLNNVYEMLMNYVKNGGNLLLQYNTSNYTGTVKSKVGPYPFVISRGRVTDEDAAVHFLAPDDPALNWPNKITQQDFKGWVQERGLYFADDLSKEYKTILSMKDPGEQDQPGSLVVANYGKGRFIYTGLAFFRQLPAGIGGAYKLFANLVANPNQQSSNGSAKRR